jgi:Tfp pilus assembly protein PilV
MAHARRILTSLLPGHRDVSDDGFSLIEVIVALGLLVAVMVTTAGFFVNSLKQTNGQVQAQEAAVLADQQLDYTRSVTSDALLSGRKQADVAAAIATPPPGVDLSQDVTSSGNWDSATQPAGTPAIPISNTTTVNGTKYTITTFVNQCYLTAKSSVDCKSAVTAFGWVYRITVDVTYLLGGGRSCAGGKPCYYAASTLRDTGTSPCFNVTVSYAGCSTAQPAIINLNPSSLATNTQTTLTLTGNNFEQGATVSLDAGGTVSNVSVVSASTITFTLTTTNTSTTAGSHTVVVTNPNGAFATTPLTITRTPINVTSVSPSTLVQASTRTFTIAGTGFNSGAQVLLDGANVNESWVSATTLTVALTSDPSTGTHTFTVTNPDGASDTGTFTVTAATSKPHITGVSPNFFQHGTQVTLTISGTGFITTGGKKQAVTINGSSSGVSSVSIVNSTTVTLKFTTNSTFYGTVPVQVTSRDGTVSDVYNWTVLVY